MGRKSVLGKLGLYTRHFSGIPTGTLAGALTGTKNRTQSSVLQTGKQIFQVNRKLLSENCLIVFSYSLQQITVESRVLE